MDHLLPCWGVYADSLDSPDVFSEAEWLEKNYSCILGVIAKQVLADDAPLSEEYIRCLVEGVQMADAIIHLRSYIKHGHIPFPKVVMEACAVDEEALWRLQSSPGLSTLLNYYGQEAERRLAKLKHLLTSAQKKQQKPLLCYAALMLALLRELDRDNYPVLTERQELTAIRKLFISWFI